MQQENISLVSSCLSRIFSFIDVAYSYIERLLDTRAQRHRWAALLVLHAILKEPLNIRYLLFTSIRNMARHR